MHTQAPPADRKRLKQTLTLYGRKPVLEALEDRSLPIDRLHLADSNKPGEAVSRLLALAEQRDIPVLYHSKRELSRISRNGKQDQGAAVDIYCPALQSFDSWLEQNRTGLPKLRVIMLAGLSNPQNLGMSIRACFAAGVDAILISTQASSGLNPLCIKASAGTALRAPLVRCANVQQVLADAAQAGSSIYALSADAEISIYSEACPRSGIFVFGNETAGISEDILSLCHTSLRIPMNAEVESLNVATSAALLAFRLCQG